MLNLEIDSNISTPAKTDNTFTQTSLQIILLRSLPKRLAIARLINHFRSKPSYEDVIRLSSEVLELLRAATVMIQTFQSRDIR